MIFARGVTTVVAIATREKVGGSVGGFVALLNAVGTIAVFGFLLTLARGLLSGTDLRGLVSIPITLPLGVLAIGLVLVWVLRGLDSKAVGGRLISDEVPDSFTGHATPVWWRLVKTHREWAILERHQPTAMVLVGLVLCLLPWTRAIGLFLFVLALLASRRAAAERRAEAEHERQLNENDPYARVLAPKKGQERIPGCKAQLLGLDPAQKALLDEKTRAELETNRERILQEENAAGVLPDPEEPEPEPELRVQLPTVRYGKTSRNILVASLVLVMNFVVGDPGGVYRFMPGGLTGMVESLDREIAVVRPQGSGPELGAGTLTRGFLGGVDPAALREREARARAAAQSELLATLDTFAAAMEQERRTGRQQLGVEFHIDAGTADFDALLLEDQEALPIWKRLLESVAGLDNDHRSARAFADGIGQSTTGEEIDRFRASAEGLLDRLSAVVADREALHTKLLAQTGRTP